MDRTKMITLFQPVTEISDELIARFEGDPGEVFLDSRASGPERWRIALHAGPAHRDVDVHLGDVWQWGDGRWRSLTWTPCPVAREFVAVERLLPSFVGELGLRTEDRSLVLTGSYVPPLGWIGTAFDATALHTLARVTARELLGDIALALAKPVTV